MTYALPPGAFDAYLSAGSWNDGADDNVTGETVPAQALRDIVLAYQANIGGDAERNAIGLLALMLGVAEWGVIGSDLPPDPAGKRWRSDATEASGKHLMSYAVGGVGIAHVDVGNLRTLIRGIASSDLVPSADKPGLENLVEVRYGKSGVVYDELRAAGICDGNAAAADLRGEPFRHFPTAAKQSYCRIYRNERLTSADWTIFRTWLRAFLRTRQGQQTVIELWLEKYWQPTLNQVPGGEGFAEEAMLNARVRNSSPSVAIRSVTRRLPRPGTSGRVQRQLDAYAEWKLATARRRWKIMMRPVTLFRHFAGLPPLHDITAP